MTKREKEIKAQIDKYLHDVNDDTVMEEDVQDIYMFYDDYVIIANMFDKLEKIEKLLDKEN